MRYKQNNKKYVNSLNSLGNLYVHCSFKNTLFYLTNSKTQLLKQWSTQSLKKTVSKKNTPYNLQWILFHIQKYIEKQKIKKLNIILKGKGLGRYFILKNIKKAKRFKIRYLIDHTSIPFNGCRARKKKRR